MDALEPTCREGVHACIRWDAMWTGAQDILFYRAGEFLSLGVERMLYITESMESFGLQLETAPSSQRTHLMCRCCCQAIITPSVLSFPTSFKEQRPRIRWMRGPFPISGYASFSASRFAMASKNSLLVTAVTEKPGSTRPTRSFVMVPAFRVS